MNILELFNQPAEDPFLAFRIASRQPRLLGRLTLFCV
jgi:hypothetical protein